MSANERFFIDLLGRTLGNRYQLVKLLGSGGFGGVFAAEDPVLGRQVAIKVLLPGASSPLHIRRFRREARLLARLQHPNIVQVLDFVEEDGLRFLVMELLQGQTLSVVVNKAFPLSPTRVVSMGVQIVEALSEAHAKGIVHRDLKPDNILVMRQRDQSDRIKVVDFGTAILADPRSTRTTLDAVFTGTPAYMSPEHCRDQPLDGRSDLYAFGCILYFMLCNRPPFLASSAIDLMLSQVGEEARPPSHWLKGHLVNTALERLSLWCLAKNAADRPASAEVVRGELLRALEVEVPEPEQTPRVVPEQHVSRTATPPRAEETVPEVALPLQMTVALLRLSRGSEPGLEQALEALGVAPRCLETLHQSDELAGCDALVVPYDAAHLARWGAIAAAAAIPWLVCGPEDDLSAMARSVELGAHDYVALPLSIQDLRRRLSRARRTRRTRR